MLCYSDDEAQSMVDNHDRMPLILQRGQVRPWLTKKKNATQILTSIPPLLPRKCMDTQIKLDGFKVYLREVMISEI